jgi:hypothetical protein
MSKNEGNRPFTPTKQANRTDVATEATLFMANEMQAILLFKQ